MFCIYYNIILQYFKLMKYIRNFSAHTDYVGEMSKIPTPSVSYCRKENECHFMPSNVIMFKVGDLNGNTNQTVTVFYYEGGSETIQIIEGNRWYVVNVPSGKSVTDIKGSRLNSGVPSKMIISAKIMSIDGWSDYGFGKGMYRNIDFINCDFSSLTTMDGLFNGNRNETLDAVSNLDTSKVTSMSKMFVWDEQLQALDVSKFDTSKVINMSGMFQYCKKIQSLDLANWNVSNVTDMEDMFDGCNSLQSLDLSSWNVSKVTRMNFMLYGCNSLQSLDFSGWNTSNLTNVYCMFNGCSSLQSLDLSSWNVLRVTSMSSMFKGCSSLQSLDLSSWDMTKVTYKDDMFSGCTSLKTIYMRNCNQTTIDKIKAQLEKDKILNNVTIITE